MRTLRYVYWSIWEWIGEILLTMSATRFWGYFGFIYTWGNYLYLKADDYAEKHGFIIPNPFCDGLKEPMYVTHKQLRKKNAEFNKLSIEQQMLILKDARLYREKME